MKTVLITGGSTGIGAGIVKEFSKAGYSVIFTYKSPGIFLRYHQNGRYKHS